MLLTGHCKGSGIGRAIAHSVCLTTLAGQVVKRPSLKSGWTAAKPRLYFCNALDCTPAAEILEVHVAAWKLSQIAPGRSAMKSQEQSAKKEASPNEEGPRSVILEDLLVAWVELTYQRMTRKGSSEAGSLISKRLVNKLRNPK